MYDKDCGYKLTRRGRVAVVYGAVNDIQNGLIGATMTQVARHMGLSPSTYVMDCLKELATDGALRCVLHKHAEDIIFLEWFTSPPEKEPATDDEVKSYWNDKK